MSSSRKIHLRARLQTIGSICLIALLTGCGSGGGGGTGGSATDFSLSITPSQVAITGGGGASVSLQVNPIGGFTSSVTVQVTGLPAGLTVSPTSITLQPNVPQKVQISAAASVVAGNLTVSFTGSGGGITHASQVALNLTAPLPLSRTKYVRTDASTEYFDFINRHWSVYNSLTNRLFVSDPSGNHVMVMDPVSRTMLAKLNVPGAFGMDDTPDHTKIYVGTLIGDVYTIDPVSMTVTGRFVSSSIGPFGFQAGIALVMSDGRLALLGAAQGILNVDGSSAFMIWNPVDNSGTVYQTPFTHSFGGPPSTVVCGSLENIAGFTRSADRTKVFLGSADSDNTFCQVDAATGADNFNFVSTFPANMAVSPDGKYVATTSFGANNSGSVILIDAHNLTQAAQFPVNGDTSSAAWLAFSSDSTTLYVSSPSIIYAYDVNTHQQTGWLPNLVVTNISGGFVTNPATGPAFVDVGNGLMAGPMEQGVGFLDVAAKHTGPVGSQFLNGFAAPPFGPVAGGNAVNLTAPNGSINSVFFGTQRATQVDLAGSAMSVVAPPASPGPSDIEILMNDGGAWILPEAYSYGPTILQVTPDASTGEGGAVGLIYGYGFGVGSLTNTIPADLKITVGGQAATVLAFDPNAYGVLSEPFQLEAVAFTIPPGTAGSHVPVVVSNASGSTTAGAAFSYLPATQVFSAGVTPLAQGIYDPLRDVYYFTDATQVQVFSKTQSRFLAPIAVAGSVRLWGISLSPDGSKLALSDASGGKIYVLNPGTPSAITSFTIPAPIVQGVIANPAGIAISDTGLVYFTVANQGGTGFHGFFKLDTTTSQFTDYNIDAPGLQTDDAFMRTAISHDGVRVYFNNGGEVLTVDTATDAITHAADAPPCCGFGLMDMALSSNNTQFSAATFTYDADLNGESTPALNDREILNVQYFFGMKYSTDASMLFQPSTLGIDVYDSHLGVLRDRVALPFAFAGTYDNLVSNGKDNVPIGITGANSNQIVIIDLSSLPEPNPLPFALSTGRKNPVFVRQNTHAAIPLRAAANASVTASPGRQFLPGNSLGTRVPHVRPFAPSSAFWKQNGKTQ
jgi:hypothetical protein